MPTTFSHSNGVKLVRQNLGLGRIVIGSLPSLPLSPLPPPRLPLTMKIGDLRLVPLMSHRHSLKAWASVSQASGTGSATRVPSLSSLINLRCQWAAKQDVIFGLEWMISRGELTRMTIPHKVIQVPVQIWLFSQILQILKMTNFADIKSKKIIEISLARLSNWTTVTLCFKALNFLWLKLNRSKNCRYIVFLYKNHFQKWSYKSKSREKWGKKWRSEKLFF